MHSREGPTMTRRSLSANEHSARPLLITRDDDLLDLVLAIADVAGREVQVAPDLASAGHAWASAPLVLMDHHAAPARVPHRRPGVVLLGRPPIGAEAWRDAVRVGAEEVIDVVTDGSAVGDRLGAVGSIAAPVVVVTSSSGGLGASSLATAVARTAARGDRSVLLVDLDPDAGGLDLALGVEEVTGARWEDLDPAEGAIDPAALLAALPSAEGLRLLSSGRVGAMPSDAAIDAIFSAARRAVDLVVVDAGRAQWPTLGRLQGTGVIAALVVSAELRGVAAGRRSAAVLEPWLADRRVVARTGHGRGSSPERVAAAVGLPLLAALADDPKAATAMERGEAPALGSRSVWRAPVEQLLDAVGSPATAWR
jgi:secretion/DNA translocation related CpaE-like protein